MLLYLKIKQYYLIKNVFKLSKKILILNNILVLALDIYFCNVKIIV